MRAQAKTNIAEARKMRGLLCGLCVAPDEKDLYFDETNGLKIRTTE